jgi:hypothetical protein
VFDPRTGQVLRALALAAAAPFGARIQVGGGSGSRADDGRLRAVGSTASARQQRARRGGGSGTPCPPTHNPPQDVGLFKASPTAAGKQRGQRRRGGAGAPQTWDRAAAAAAAASGGIAPKPGTMCYECGSKQTPQWREGPAGARGAAAEGQEGGAACGERAEQRRACARLKRPLKPLTPA